MLKFFLGLTFLLLCALIGVKLTEKKKFVLKFFEALKEFNAEFAIDISLYYSAVSEKLKLFNEKTSGVISGYETIFDGERFICKDKRLNPRQREFVTEYINALGRYDTDGQREFFLNAEKKIDIFLNDCKEKSRKYSALALKLALCMGFAFLILII